ncbi:peptidoglycan-binding domain-containing protein [Streptomyces griseoaurantiacus]|uniref:Peptidoglycan-binding protein n=1 Tax=Streptomyces griseoaurantiacus TaxID=68213 RepID=A0ABZ1UY69_9ACTN|nr:peptidoglycan-binding domain-containing protein [Streptomyces jietaisiensis]
MASEHEAADTLALRVTAREEADRGVPPTGRRRRRTVGLAVAAVLLTGTTGALVLWSGGDGNGPAPESGPGIRKVAVVRTDLSGSKEMDGTLGYDSPRTLRGTGEGRVTWLPARGATVTRGHQLYRVDERPTVLLYGSTPLYRRLDTPGTVGRDVRVLADNLKALGYDIGPQPAPGSVVRRQAPGEGSPRTDRAPGAGRGTPSSGASASPTGPPAASGGGEGQGTGEAGEQQPGASAGPARSTVRRGDGVLTASLMSAVERWQKAAGLDPTGVLDPADAVVAKSAVRVSGLRAQPGDEAADELMSLTSTTKTVTVPVESLDLGSVSTGRRVTVVLPDRSTTPGRVAAISTVVQGGGGESGEGGEGGDRQSTTNVTVSLDDPRAVKSLDSAPVQARFHGRARKHVLAVPVGALLALREGGYAVRRADGRLVPVDTGMFARGLVEISGKGVDEGTKVETTA